MCYFLVEKSKYKISKSLIEVFEPTRKHWSLKIFTPLDWENTLNIWRQILRKWEYYVLQKKRKLFVFISCSILLYFRLWYKLKVFNVFWTSFVLSSKLWSGLIFRANICLFIYLSYFFGPAVSSHLTFPTVLLLTILCFIKSELISQALQPFETRCTWGRRLRFFWYSHKRLAFQISWSFTYG